VVSDGNGGWITVAQKGIEVSVPLSEVYHVIGVEFETPPAVDGIFYWENDASTAWLSADGRSGRVADAVLKVTYSNGQTRTRDMITAVRMNTVWYNNNPSGNERPLTVRGIYDTVKYENKQQLDDVWPNLKGKTAPQITFYYRGYKVPYDVYVFNRLASVTATPKNGVSPIVANMIFQDNDNVGKNAAWFKDQIDVVATFTASSDSNKTKPLTLTYEATAFNAGGADATLADAQEGKILYGRGTGASTYTNWQAVTSRNASPGSNTYGGGPLVYSMDFGTPDWKWNSTKKVYEIGDNAWGVSATAKNGAVKKVTIYYTPGVGTSIPFAYDGDIPGVKKASVDVQWNNIPGPQD